MNEMAQKENIENVEATTIAAGSIKQIDKGVVHQICSGQVVLSLATAVKELVENSLDAGATVIEVKLRDYGAENVEVTDNGHGVEENNFKGLTIKHATSKLRDFSDLTSVETFGFRGEALSSLCALSKLTISTRHAHSQLGTVLEYDHNGAIVSQKNIARPVGTTVTIHNIFSTMPVRQKEFQRNVKKEYSKLMSVMTAYGLVSSGVKIKVTNLKSKNKVDVVMQTQGSENLRDNLVNIFGVKIMSSLKQIVQTKLTEEDLQEAGIKGQMPDVKLLGFISSPVHGEGRGSPDRQFLFINNRPCDHVKLTKIINQIYHGYNRHQFPFICLNIVTEKDTVDVNITPDKRQIFLTQEKYLLELVKKTLEKMFEDSPCTMPLQSFMPKEKEIQHHLKKEESKKSLDISSLKRSFSKTFSEDNPSNSNKKHKTLLDFVKVSPSGDDSSEARTYSKAENTFPLAADQKPTSEVQSSDEIKEPEIHNSQTNKSYGGLSLVFDDFSSNTEIGKHDQKYFEETKKDPEIVGSQAIQTGNGLSLVFDDFSTAGESGKNHDDVEEEVKDTPEITSSQSIKTSNGISLVFDDFSSAKIKSNSTDELNTEENPASINSQTVKTGNGLALVFDDFSTGEKNRLFKDDNKMNVQAVKTNGNQMNVHTNISEDRSEVVEMDKLDDVCDTKVTEKKRFDVSFDFSALRQSMKKSENMPEISENNVNFRAQISPSENSNAENELKKQLKKEDFVNMKVCGQFNLGFIIASLRKDLFIVDQHATDEKYNFETLQKTTVIKSQKMVVPQNLELTSVNESILMDNMEVFEKNGFKFEIDEDAPSTQRIKLISKPMSKNWTFGKDDIEELIFMMSEMGSEDISRMVLRPSRVTAMFASRACRSSVMIGRSLTSGHMTQLVRHMASMDQPWNCPHGRPTLRHLINTDMARL